MLRIAPSQLSIHNHPCILHSTMGSMSLNKPISTHSIIQLLTLNPLGWLKIEIESISFSDDVAINNSTRWQISWFANLQVGVLRGETSAVSLVYCCVNQFRPEKVENETERASNATYLYFPCWSRIRGSSRSSSGIAAQASIIALHSTPDTRPFSASLTPVR